MNAPSYLSRPQVLARTAIGRIMLQLTQWPIQWFIRLFLIPRGGDVGNLSTPEVMRVYDREARSYDRKHHFTTRGQDTMWRRYAAWCVVNMARRLERPVRVLDLCTGTGLTIEQIITMMRLWNLSASVIGLDLNGPMLQVARQRSFPPGWAAFIKGDACDPPLPTESIDVVTQVFGIGGIPDPLPVFRSVLRVLRVGGEFCLIDMHQPIAELPGEIPLVRWIRTPNLEALTYTATTIPLALARLWGWRDTTRDFYLAPLSVDLRPRDRQWYGFEIMSFSQESERWWFGLPVMPTARLLIRKVPITPEEAARRNHLATHLRQ